MAAVGKEADTKVFGEVGWLFSLTFASATVLCIALQALPSFQASTMATRRLLTVVAFEIPILVGLVHIMRNNSSPRVATVSQGILTLTFSLVGLRFLVWQFDGDPDTEAWATTALAATAVHFLQFHGATLFIAICIGLTALSALSFITPTLALNAVAVSVAATLFYDWRMRVHEP